MRLIISFIFFFSINFSVAQITRWINPMNAGFPVIQNQGWTDEIGLQYQRLPNRAKEKVRPPVWELSGNTAGLAIHFFTNAPKITVRYQIIGSPGMNHMPPTGKSGISLYAIENNRWEIASGSFSFADTVVCTYDNLKQNNTLQGVEYRMFLPLYSGVKWMEIGVPEAYDMRLKPIVSEKPVIVYGTSIAQGGCASRPGMAWTNIVCRMLGKPVVNLAFSGNGGLEKEMVDLINELDAALYIYDCLPNMGKLSDDEIYKRVIYGVTALRKKHTAPILLVEHIGYTNDETNINMKAAWQRLNLALKKAYNELKKQGVKNIWYLSKEAINFPKEGCVDYIHPSDWGMQVYAEAYVKMIQSIFKKQPAGDKRMN